VTLARVASCLAAAFAAAAVGAPARAENPGDYLVTSAATWRYRDDGSNQGTAWRDLAFDDSAWAQGGAELGYGDGDEVTVVSCGPNAPTCTSSNFVTTYFRKAFTVNDAASIAQLELAIRRDDGAVAYLNGVEVARTNMPAGTITSSTLASSSTGNTFESLFFPFVVPASAVVNGSNVLAIEVHQNSPISSDVSFDASLRVATPDQLAVRAPYIQNVTPTSAVLRWRTTFPQTTRVQWGTAVGALVNGVDVPGTRTEHEVALTGLTPEATIYYSVGSTTQVIAGDDADHFVRLPPLAGQRRPTRVWVIGDAGACAASPTTGCNNVAAMRDGFLAWAGAQKADLWLMLGDNAYQDGTDAQFTTGQFGVFPTLMRNTPFWSVPGNHEFGAGGSDSPTQSGPYYDAHTFPTAGEAGGVPSGTEAYYAFDWGNVHYVMLDSHDTSRAAPANPTTNVCPPGQGGAMYQWLCADLAATEQDFVIAVWHHPPYSKGSHDSDLESQLVEMRQRFMPVLEAYGVDLVLTGHSHGYERSVLIDGHYGTSSTYAPAVHAVDAGDGSPSGDGAYEKAALGPVAHTGSVSIVAGHGSQTSVAPLNHPIMIANDGVEVGSVVLDVVGRRLDARMIAPGGLVRDWFRLVKGDALPACSDGIDQDGDGRFDFPSDPGCADPTGALEDPQCDDGADNDGDTLVDLDDADCTDSADLLEGTVTACSDGLDNDGDGLADFPSDPGCPNLAGTTESPQCNDLVDNDGDTLIDLLDPQCASAADDDEAPPPPLCADGLDNDADGQADFPADPGCASAASDTEAPACNDGLDNDGDGPADLADPDCTAASDDDESAPIVCSDGVDNDGDGLTDFPADPGCASAASSRENPACDDELDNDGDGRIDWDGGALGGTPDPHCTTPHRGRETPGSCGAGMELALLLPAIAALRRRRER
jgi:hypothetical protein